MWLIIITQQIKEKNSIALSLHTDIYALPMVALPFELMKTSPWPREFSDFISRCHSNA